jgi:hypothetical protein
MGVMIFLLAGRRIDLPDAVPARFPLRNVPLVRTRLAALFEGHRPGTLVCSAACGADLLGLETAGKLGWRRRVILPFDRDHFRNTSVMDRPGDWGPLYDRILDDVSRTGNLLVESAAGEDPYSRVNDSLIREAARLAADSRQNLAVALVWDGDSYGPEDLTAQFGAEARRRAMIILPVSTLE